jgi:hypothetical protein
MFIPFITHNPFYGTVCRVWTVSLSYSCTAWSSHIVSDPLQVHLQLFGLLTTIEVTVCRWHIPDCNSGQCKDTLIRLVGSIPSSDILTKLLQQTFRLWFSGLFWISWTCQQLVYIALSACADLSTARQLVTCLPSKLKHPYSTRIRWCDCQMLPNVICLFILCNCYSWGTYSICCLLIIQDLGAVPIISTINDYWKKF